MRPSSRPSWTTPALAGALALLSADACVLGARAVVEVSASYSLSDIDAVRLELPDTPIDVRGVPEQSTLELRGRWYSTGGSESIAVENSEAPRLDFEVSGRFARLAAVLPLAERELVDLEVDEVTLAPNRDLEIWTGLGDIVVTHMQGNISIDIERGTIYVVGGAGGVAARTTLGDVEIHSPGPIDVSTGQGDLLLLQDGPGGNPIYARSDSGDIEVTLRSAQNLHLKITAYEDIRVQTSSVSTVTSESFERTVGNGTVDIFLEARIGSVTVLHDEFGDG